MIEKSLHFALHDYQNENRIYSGFGWRREPDIVPPLKPAIAHNRKAADGSVEVDGSVEIAAIDRDMRPANWHCGLSVSKKETRRQSYGSAPDLLAADPP